MKSLVKLVIIGIMLTGCAGQNYTKSMSLTEYESLCPYGDAVLTKPGEYQTVSVDCVNYNSTNHTWVVWKDNPYNTKEYSLEWTPYTVDGSLHINRSSNTVYVKDESIHKIPDDIKKEIEQQERLDKEAELKSANPYIP